MAQKHNVSCIEKPMTVATTEQGPQKRYRRLRFPSFDSVVWSEKNPLLQKGELGHEKDTGRFKVGDGVTYWEDLPYNSVGDKGEKGDDATINGYNTLTIVEGTNIELTQEGNTLTISALGEASGTYTKEEIDDKVTVINTAIDANADAIQKTREDYMDADTDIMTIVNAHASELTTQRNDIDGLGDQVSAIEEKIPETTSADNMLVNNQQMSDMEMNLREDIDTVDGELQTQINAQATAITNINNVIPVDTSTTNQLVNATQLATKADTTYVDGQLAQKQDKATAVNYDNITNCITEIPQDIKLELNDGVLTLKAGSKYYKPDGTYVVRDTDYDIPIAWNSAASGIIVIGNDSYSGYAENRQLSGATNPTGLQGNSFLFWNTTEKKMYWTINGGSTWNAAPNCSVPIARVTWGADNKITSINEIYNGFGYMGSTVFALPGVKGLRPDGRNEDGTLKNASFNTNKVLTVQVDKTTTKCISLNNNNSIGIYREYVASESTPNALYSMWYQPSSNIMFNTGNNNPVKATIAYIIEVSYDGKKITYFNPKTAFHAVDYSDVVHKTGDEIISGSKTFESTIHIQKSGLSIYNNSVTKGTNPTSTQYWAGILWNDKTDAATSWQNSRLGYLEMSLNTAGETKLAMGAYKNGADSTASATIAAGYSSSGAWATAPTPSSSSNGTNIATTAFVKSVLSSNNVGLASFSKAANGYYKFNNGLIIQWGRTSATTGGARTITFPTAFTTKNYQVCPIPLVAGETISFYAIALSDTEKTTTTAVIRGGADVSKTGWSWVAIGY